MCQQAHVSLITAGPLQFSHKKDEDFTTECDHQHNLRCNRCDLIPSVFDEVELALKDSALALIYLVIKYIVNPCMSAK